MSHFRTKKDDGRIKNESGDEPFDTYLKKTGNLSVFAFLCLITGLILITIRQFLPAGLMVIAGALLFTMVLKNYTRLLSTLSSDLVEIRNQNRKKENVITDFSHRIREPLNNLVVLSDIMMSSDLPARQKELIGTFVASTSNMVTTVNELTMQSAVDVSFEKRRHIRFNLLTTIKNTIELYNLKDGSNIDFILNRKDPRDFYCSGDPIVLKQIFLDLFHTIEKQEKDSPTKVTINLTREKMTDSEMHVSFRVQTDKRIVFMDEEQHKRNLAARLISSGRGYYTQEFGNNLSVLKFHMPFRYASTDAEPVVIYSVPDAGKASPAELTDLKDLKVLLVEDNLINQKITLLSLKSLVREIDTASNGKEAVEKCSSTKYDLVLMDIQMPVMDGLEAAARIREAEAGTDSHVPIIAITANAMLGDKEECLSAGIDDYISKPFQPAQLIDKIRDMFS